MGLSRVYSVVAVGLLSASCAVGNAGDIPCTSDADCPAGRDCDLEELICVQANIVTGNNENIRVAPNSTPNGQSNNANVGTNNVSTNNASTNNNPNNAATNNNTSTNNQNSCTPACEAPATCQGGTCVLPDCGAVGDPCDVSRPSQGGFTCLDLDGEGVCAEPCNAPYRPDTCGTGEYCLTVSGMNVCLPSACTTNADCTDGTCIDFSNDFSFCVPAGALVEGDTCEPGDDQCGVDLACDPLTNVCEPLCDPWGASTCSAGHVCGVALTARMGICTHSLDSTAPNDPFNECLDDQTACDDGVGCFNLGTVNGCLRYCRAGQADCAGVVTAQSTQTVCDEYALYEPGLGICWPPCDPQAADPCGVGAVCLNQLCRTTCTPGNEVADCCGGSSPCPAYCNPVNNLCE